MEIFFQNAFAQSGITEPITNVQNKVTGFAMYFWNHLPDWIAGALFIFGSIILARIASRIVADKISARLEKGQEEAEVIAGRGTYTIVLALGVTVGLKIAGIDLTTILAAVAFGIGFALRDLILNFLSGVLILIQRQFTIGDFIKVGDQIGKVVDIQTRATVLRGIDGTKVIIPNSELFTKRVISYTTNPTRRFEIIVGVSYETDLELALKAALKTLKNQPFILKDPNPGVIVTEFTNSSINLSLRFWLTSRENWLRRRSQIIVALKKEFDRVGINIPFPLQTIVFDKDTKTEASTHAGEYEKARQEYVTKSSDPNAIVNVEAGGVDDDDFLPFEA